MQPERIDNRYELLDTIGRGGMGSVHAAYDRLTGQTVALKRVRIVADPAGPPLSQTASDHLNSLRLALAQEFSTLAGLRHQHIISVLDYGFDAHGQPYFTMNLLDNAVTITEAARQLEPSACVSLLVELLLALAYLHRRGVIHRDLKPSNVLVDREGRVKTLDFGLATENVLRERTTGIHIVGTPTHMAPEVIQGQPATEAADLYAVGIIAYQMLAGHHPFDTSSQHTLFHDILHSDPDLSMLPEVLQPPSPRPRATTTQDAPTTALPRTQPASADQDAPTRVDPQSAAVEPPTSVLPVAPLTASPPPNTTPPMPTAPPPRPHGLTPTLREVVGRLLHKDPALRYQDANQVISDLCAAAGLPTPPETATLRQSYLEAARLVGRQNELATLVAAAERVSGRALPGTARLAGYLIGGESGVGKSRLLDALRVQAMVQGLLVVRGQAVEGGGLAYQVWREPVRRLILNVTLTDLEASILKALVPDIADLIGRPVADAPELTAAGQQQRLALAITDLFRRQPRPVLLLLEDLHWTSESLELLKTLLRFAPGLPLLIVGSYRDDEVADLPAQLPAMQHVRLGRLDAEAVMELSVSMLGEAGRNPQLVALLQRETEGNTFFMVEVVRALAEEAGRMSAIDPLRLPQTVMAGGVQQIVRRRVGRVPESAHDLLRLAAVSGRQLDLDVLRAALLSDMTQPGYPALAALDDFLAAAADAAVIEVYDNAWRFTHDKIREQILADLRADEYPILHRRVALALEAAYPDDDARRDRAEMLMTHWRQAGDAARELYYLEIAAQMLSGPQAEFALARALAERGLTLAQDDTTRYRLHALLGMCDEITGNLDQAETHYAQALALAEAQGDENGQALGLIGLSAVARLRSQRDRTLTLAEQALMLAYRVDDKHTIARSLDAVAAIFLNSGEYERAQTYFNQSLPLYREMNDQRRLANAITNLGVIANNMGKLTLAQEYFDQSLPILEAIGERRHRAQIINNLGVLAANAGDLAGARAYFMQALSVQREVGDRHTEAMNLNNLGSISDYLGDYPNALRYYSEGLALAQELDDPRTEATVRVGLAKAQIALGQHDAAREQVRLCLTMALEHNILYVLTEGLVKLAQLALRDGDAERAAVLCGLADAHPATYAEVRTMQIAPLLAEIAGVLPPEVLETTLRRGADQDLYTVVRAALAG